MAVQFRSLNQLEAGVDHVLKAPRNGGKLKMIVRRPAEDQREVIPSGMLDEKTGLIGDNWLERGCGLTEDGSAHPDMQLNIMSSRAIALIAGDEEYWPLAGDQLYIDMDLSEVNMPAGTQLSIGSCVIEVTAEPHTGCKKFAQRYGEEALKFVNSPLGKQLHLRGINAKVIQSGLITVGDEILKQ